MYFDANVWVSYFLEEGGTFDISKKQLERILSGDEVGLLSHLVICEIIDVSKKKLLEKEPFKGMDPEHLELINREIRERIQEILSRIIKLAREKKILVINSQKTLAQSYIEIYAFIDRINNEIRQNNYCPVCDVRISHPTYKYRKIGHYDIQHALIAREFSATDFVTYDKAFPQLFQLKEFELFPLTVLQTR